MDLFAELDDRQYNPIAINPGVSGTAVAKIDFKDRSKGIHRKDAEKLVAFVESMPENKQFDVNGMPMDKKEAIEWLKRRIYG